VNGARATSFRYDQDGGYDDADLGVVEDVAARRLGDLMAFVAAMRTRIG